MIKRTILAPVLLGGLLLFGPAPVHAATGEASSASDQPGPSDQDSDGITDIVECSPPDPAALGNGDYEQPALASGTWVKEDEVPSWETTESTHLIEIWRGGGHSGPQFVELNGHEDAALFQDVKTVPGSLFLWSLAHRGREGTDVMELRIGPQATSTEAATTADVVAMPLIATITDSNQAWGEHSGVFKVPEGQTDSRFGFLAKSTSTGNKTVGNFLDAVVFTPCPDTDADKTPDALDTDSDNDGTPDATEGTEDVDGDGVANWRDPKTPAPPAPEPATVPAITDRGPALAPAAPEPAAALPRTGAGIGEELWAALGLLLAGSALRRRF